jgi:hypothetical protein
VDTVYFYLGWALYYGFLAAFWVMYAMLLGYFLWHKQWLFVFLSIVFTVGFYQIGPFIVLGPMIVLIVAWQEAEKWNIKKFVRIYSAVLVCTFIAMSVEWYKRPVKKEDQISATEEGRRRAVKNAGAAAAAKKH